MERPDDALSRVVKRLFEPFFLSLLFKGLILSKILTFQIVMGKIASKPDKSLKA
jgi:hypothetical protein